MNLPTATLMWIPMVLGGCDLIFPPCTNLKREVCACDDAGPVMCDVAETAEEKAKEYKDNDDQDRYDSAQDACETLLDAWDEADGCSQFEDENGSSSDGGSGGDDDGDDDDGGDEDGAGADGQSQSGVDVDATLYCQGECSFTIPCWGEEESTCVSTCRDFWESDGYCDGPEVIEWGTCSATAAVSCDEDAWGTCSVDFYGLDICE